MEAMKRDVKSGVDSVGQSVTTGISEARADIDTKMMGPSQAPHQPEAQPVSHPLNGATPHLPAEAECAQIADYPKTGT